MQNYVLHVIASGAYRFTRALECQPFIYSLWRPMILVCWRELRVDAESFATPICRGSESERLLLPGWPALCAIGYRICLLRIELPRLTEAF